MHKFDLGQTRQLCTTELHRMARGCTRFQVKICGLFVCLVILQLLAAAFNVPHPWEQGQEQLPQVSWADWVRWAPVAPVAGSWAVAVDAAAAALVVGLGKVAAGEGGAAAVGKAMAAALVVQAAVR